MPPACLGRSSRLSLRKGHQEAAGVAASVTIHPDKPGHSDQSAGETDVGVRVPLGLRPLSVL
jgi:hypothetical protein